MSRRRKYDRYDKHALVETYETEGTFSKAARTLGISRTSFRQQYLIVLGKCVRCMGNLDRRGYSCSACLRLHQKPYQNSIKQCSNCGAEIRLQKGQSKVSWTKKKMCPKCILKIQRRCSKDHYLRNRKIKLVRQESSEGYKEYQRLYRNSPIGKIKRNASENKRRAQKAGTAAENINSYIEYLFSKYTQCPYCGSLEKPTIDHIHPLNKGGTHTEDNVELICRRCNDRKGIKTKEEFKEFLIEMNKASDEISQGPKDG